LERFRQPSEGRKEVNLAAFALARRNLFHTALERVFTMHRSLWLATRHHAQPRKKTVGDCAISDRLLDNKRVPFLGTDPEVAGRNVYPWDITKQEIDTYLE
jgi:hypothetical protein